MLFIINAAEVQFRHETASRSRDHALIASIRDRRAAQTALAIANDVDARPLAPDAPAPVREASRTTRVTWARPVEIASGAKTACATG